MHMERLFVNNVFMTPVGGIDTGVSFSACGCASISGFRLVVTGSLSPLITGKGITMDHNAATGNWAIKWELAELVGSQLGTYLAIDVLFITASTCSVNPSIANNAWTPP